MLNRNQNGLEVFDNFRIDNNLPKYKEQKENSGNRFTGVQNPMDFDADSTPITPMGIGGFSSGFESDREDSYGGKEKKSIFRIIIDFFKNLFGLEKKPKMTISQFFMAIKDSATNIEKYVERSNGYLKALEYAKKMNQHALVDELKVKMNEVKYESLLYGGGFTTVITEEQVVKFYKECQKGLALTYIKNYIRVIPEKVSEKKIEADGLKVFDNYVILHFDKDKKAYKVEKDPIIFGVIAGIRKLYYIADYIDEYCDLTLEQFITKFGDEAIRANDINVNVDIKKKN